MVLYFLREGHIMKIIKNKESLKERKCNSSDELKAMYNNWDKRSTIKLVEILLKKSN